LSSAVLRCCPRVAALGIVAAAQLPVMVAGMEIVPAQPVASPLAILGLAGTMAYWCAGTSMIVAIPAAVRRLEQEVEGIMVEVADGTKLVVHCATRSLLAAVVLLFVWGLYWFACKMGEMCVSIRRRGASERDAFLLRYGGRLRGGMRRTAQDVCGREAAIGRPERAGMVDPNRLKIGDYCSFLYWKGERMGQRRTVKLIKKVEHERGIRLICQEALPAVRGSEDIDAQSLVETERPYWPTLTSDTVYVSEEAAREEDVREYEFTESNPVAAPQLTPAAARARAALGASASAQPSAIEVFKSRSLGLIADKSTGIKSLWKRPSDEKLDTLATTETTPKEAEELTVEAEQTAETYGGYPLQKTPPQCFPELKKEKKKDRRRPGLSKDLQETAERLQEVLKQIESGEGKAITKESWSNAEDRARYHDAVEPLRRKMNRSAASSSAQDRIPLREVPKIRCFADPTPKFFTGGEMLPAVMQVFEGMTRSFDAWCYQIDHTEICGLLVSKLYTVQHETGDKCRGRLILDKKNFGHSSCARQACRITELSKAGCEMRVIKPSLAGFACMHVKTWIVDGAVLFTGSVNMTHNGLENNKEHLYKMEGEDILKPLRKDFEETWRIATPVTPLMLAAMQETDAARKLKRSDSAPVNRSLSEEIEEAC